MKRFLFGVTFAAILLCTRDNYTPPRPREQQKIEQPATLDEAVNETIKIASFNIQIFGKSKREKEEVMQVLEKIVRNFDIVAIQEFRDKSETTLPYFVDRINAQGEQYGFVGSPRLGRTVSKEKYAFIYNKNTVYYRDISFVYDDILDVFEREPFIAAFRSGDFDYTLVNIHTKPDDATNEIHALADVIMYADERVSDDNDVIVLGDFNADGSYFSETTATGLRDSQYLWIVPDDFDTTVAKGNYTYDRIVVQKQNTEEDFAGRVEVFRFDTVYNLNEDFTKRVSDHYPVWALFYTNKDTD